MNKEMAETLVHTGPGTPMGNLMRRYWVPVLLSSEIAEPDGPQLRVQIMGEKLLAFRDTAGEVGLIDEFCSHRGVSLYFGRNEENGIRCAYHGLKFARDGRCVDVPSAPQACAHMGIKAYPCIERAGIVWAYMGPKDKQPAAAGSRMVRPAGEPRVRHQAAAGDATTCRRWKAASTPPRVVRASLRDGAATRCFKGAKANDYIKADGNVVFDIEKNDFGLTLYGRRNGEPDSYYWRITQWLFPWFTLIPPFGHHALGGHVWVPIDDEHCWAWSMNWRPDEPLTAEERARDGRPARASTSSTMPGRSARRRTVDNDYLIDRRRAEGEARVQRRVRLLDPGRVAAGEHGSDPGPRSARSCCRPTARSSMARRMLYEAATGLAQGNEPPALDAGKQRVRAAGVLLDRDAKPQEWARRAPRRRPRPSRCTPSDPPWRETVMPSSIVRRAVAALVLALAALAIAAVTQAADDWAPTKAVHLIVPLPGEHRRRARAPRAAGAAEGARAAGGRGEQGRRGRQHRRGLRRQVAARRTHAARRLQRPAGGQPEPLHEPALRPGEGSRADHAGGDVAAIPGRASEPCRCSNVAEFVALAKAQPGKLSYASVSIGSASHLTMEMLKCAAHVDVVHVPYKGSQPGGGRPPRRAGAGGVLRAGQRDAVHAGRQAARRSRPPGRSALPRRPDMPTMIEQGYPDFVALSWIGFLAPAGTPRPIIDRYNRELVRILHSPEVARQARDDAVRARRGHARAVRAMDPERDPALGQGDQGNGREGRVTARRPAAQREDRCRDWRTNRR